MNMKNFSAIFAAIFCVLMSNATIFGQTSTQNFGTGTGSQTSQTASTSFLPNPTSGTTYARAGAVAPNAPIVLADTSNPLGTAGSYVRGVASSSTSVAKFSPMIGYTGSTEFYTSFKVLFGDAAAGNTASSGTWSFYQGAGAMYSDANNFSGAQVFTGLTFTYGAGGALNLAYRNGSVSSTTGLTQTAFNQGTVYTVEIVGNNKASGAINYTYNGAAQSVAVQKFDLYINGALIGDDLAEALLPGGTNIASNTFIGQSSTANAANVFVDDVVTYNAVPAAIGTTPNSNLQFSAPTFTVDEGSGSATITVTRTGGTDGAIGVSYASGAGGTATGGEACGAGIDYVNASGTLSWASGESAAKTFSITICDDGVFESPSPETVNLGLSNPTGGAALGSPNAAVLGITENDSPPTFSIDDVSQAEGNAGATGFVFTITKTGAATINATVDFGSADGTATTLNNDYQGTSGTLTFLPADTTKTITVLVGGDGTVEPNETFFLDLSNPSNSTIIDNQGQGTIQNDDLPSVSVDSPSFNETNSANFNFNFTVTLSSPSAQNVTVDFQTTDGTATSASAPGQDYVTTSGQVVFLPGETSKPIQIPVFGDTTPEPNETFFVTLSNSTGATLGMAVGTGTILNDDGGDTTAPYVAYTPIPSNPGSTSLTATASDTVGVTGVSVFWSIDGGAYTSAPCSSAGGTPQLGTWTCVINGAANPSAVAYFVTATDAAGNSSSYPIAGAASPDLFTIGAATVSAGTYTSLNLGQGVTLGGSVVVNDSLNLNGIINTGANILTIECAAGMTGGGEASYVLGNLEKRFCALETFTYPVGAAFALPPAAEEKTFAAPEGTVSNYSPLTVQIVGGTPGSSLTVSATDAFMAGVVQNNSISRYWTLTENGNLTANLTFAYRIEDVVGNETQYNVLRRAGISTSNYPGGTVDGANNTFSASNVSDFSQWSAGVAVPTAASAEISGRLVTASGEGIRNATVMLMGGSLTHPVYVQTGTFGAYRFGDLAVGQVYFVTVISKRYTFANPTRVISLSDSVTNENFVADEH